METKDIGIININKQNKFKVKCFKYYEPEIKRNLMIHEDVDTKNSSSVSDEVTGYRLFTINQNIHSLKMEQVQERMDKFIRHFTPEGIAEEFKRVEEVLKNLSETKTKKK